MVTVLRRPLWNKKQTGRDMYWLVSRFASDIAPAAASLSLQEFYDRVKRIPYAKDKKRQETVARPALLLKEFPALDCKKKSILCASYLQLNGIPWRFVSSSIRRDKQIHHVFVQGLFHDQWKNVDATYPFFKLFAPKPNLTKIEVLSR